MTRDFFFHTLSRSSRRKFAAPPRDVVFRSVPSDVPSARGCATGVSRLRRGGAFSNCGACYRNRERGIRAECGEVVAEVERRKGVGPVNCSFYANDTRNVPLKARRIDSACSPTFIRCARHETTRRENPVQIHSGVDVFHCLMHRFQHSYAPSGF